MSQRGVASLLSAFRTKVGIQPGILRVARHSENADTEAAPDLGTESSTIHSERGFLMLWAVQRLSRRTILLFQVVNFRIARYSGAIASGPRALADNDKIAIASQEWLRRVQPRMVESVARSED